LSWGRRQPQAGQGEDGEGRQKNGMVAQKRNHFPAQKKSKPVARERQRKAHGSKEQGVALWTAVEPETAGERQENRKRGRQKSRKRQTQKTVMDKRAEDDERGRGAERLRPRQRKENGSLYRTITGKTEGAEAARQWLPFWRSDRRWKALPAHIGDTL